MPFSLGQVHVAEGEPDIWDRRQDDSGLLALQAGVVVRDKFPDRFLDVHGRCSPLATTTAGHCATRPRCGAVLDEQGVDADAVLAEIDGGDAARHRAGRARGRRQDHQVWGVPTFILGDQAAFVRLWTGPRATPTAPSRTIERSSTCSTAGPSSTSSSTPRSRADRAATS